MRPSVAHLLPLAFLFACSRTHSSAPAPTTDASLPVPSAVPVPVPSAAPAPVACLGHRVEWTSVGGLVSEHDKQSISGCRTYRVTFSRGDGDRPAPPCTAELGPSGAPPTLDDLARALSDPVVVDAFVRGGWVGRSNTPHDGTNSVVTLDGKTLTIGGGAPEKLQALRGMLGTIAARELERCRGIDAGAMQGDPVRAR